MITDSKLDFWIKNNLNVLMVGKHGVGKTSSIVDAFNRHKLNWLYFSASTMDPWVDMIGVPKEHVDENGNAYLELVRPKSFQEDSIEAIYFDEYNRSAKKIRNAVMELIQFKSINGKKFNNLRMIWASINPDEEDEDLDYDVEKLDPAQKDRFHIIVNIPYKISLSYFKSKYGQETTDSAASWWNALNQKMKNEISPRRLDYAIDIHKKGGDLRDVLPKGANVSNLIKTLNRGPILKKYDEILKTKDNDKIKDFVNNPDNLNDLSTFFSEKKVCNTIIPYLNNENLISSLKEEKLLNKFVRDFNKNNVEHQKVVDAYLKANKRSNNKLYTKMADLRKKYFQPPKFVAVKSNADTLIQNAINQYNKCQTYNYSQMRNMVVDYLNRAYKLNDMSIIDNAASLDHIIDDILIRTQIGSFINSGYTLTSKTLSRFRNNIKKMNLFLKTKNTNFENYFHISATQKLNQILLK